MHEQLILTRHIDNIALRINTRINQLIYALHELDRMTVFLFEETKEDIDAIDAWLENEDFAVDEDGFFQSRRLVQRHRQGHALENAVSCSWGKHLRTDPLIRRRMFALRKMGETLSKLNKRLPYAALIYYQDITNSAIQYPFIDQRTVITWDFNWHEYHTFRSVAPRNNPSREVQWTQPTIDCAGEGLIISVSIPLYLNDQFTGVWSIDVPMRNLHEECITDHIFINQETFIIDKNRTFVFHPKIPHLIEKTEGSIFRERLDLLGDGFSELTVKGLVSRQNTPFTLWNNQEALVVCACVIPSLDWILLSSVPKRVLADVVSKRVETVLRNIRKGDLSERISREPLPSHWQSLIDALNDMSESLQQAHTREQHLNAVIRSVRRINKLIVVEKDPRILVQAACNILVDARDYRHAWLALIGADGSCEHIAEAGLGDGFAPIREKLNRGNLPKYCRLALESSTVVISRPTDDVVASCPISKRFPSADKLTARLTHDDVTYGVLSITVDRRADDDDELSLVQQLTEDLALALHGRSLREKQAQTVKALQKLNDELEQQVASRTAVLQVVNEELEAFSHSISHDPIPLPRSITEFSRVLLEDYRDTLDSEGKEVLGRIVVTMDQTARLIDTLLQPSQYRAKGP